jgi:hypothetical protein
VKEIHLLWGLSEAFWKWLFLTTPEFRQMAKWTTGTNMVNVERFFDVGKQCITVLLMMMLYHQ